MSVSFEVIYKRTDNTLGCVTCADQYQNDVEYYTSIGYTIESITRTETCAHCTDGTRQAKNTRNQFKRVTCEHCKGNYILSEERII
jgi:hypothetical protein